MFSKACEYGIKASVYLVSRSLQDKKASLSEIAAAINSPEAYTSKILQQLVHADIIVSEKGPGGGFSIRSSRINSLKLGTIVELIDKNGIYKDCGLGFQSCDESHPCLIHKQFTIIREDFRNMLRNTALVELSRDMENGISFLKA